MKSLDAKDSIEIYNENHLIESKNEIFKIKLFLYNCPSFPISVRIFGKNSPKIYSWKMDPYKEYYISCKDAPSIYSIYFNKINEESFIRTMGFEAQEPLMDNKWQTIELFIENVNKKVWHISYAVIINDKESKIEFYKYIEKIFLQHYFNIHSLFKINKINIRILSRNIVIRDAVSNFVLGLAGTLKSIGLLVKLYSHDTCPEYAGLVSPTALLQHDIQKDDIIIYNYSIYDDLFPLIANLKCAKKIIYFHNVTPGYLFKPYDINFFSQRLDNAKLQYPIFSLFDAVIANSIFSLECIRPYLKKDTPTLVHPPFFSLHRLKVTPEPLPLPQSRYLILWVGRCAPHKRPELAMQIFGELIKLDMDASLILVGGGWHDFPAYGQMLDACLASLPPETRQRIQHLENLTDGQLAFLYRHASVLLCTSAHEGYCMPLAEASAFGTPIAAMPQPAVEETLNGTGCILPEDPQQAAHRLRNFLLCDGKISSTAGRTAKTQVDPDAFLALLE